MDQMQNSQYFGKLIVQTTAASNAIPIQGATVVVRVRDDTGKTKILNVLHSNADGRTEPIEIATPSPEISLSPGGIGKPFTEVLLEISADGYYSIVDTHVPIYPGITSIQPAWMIPVPESTNGSRFPPGNIIINESYSTPNL